MSTQIGEVNINLRMSLAQFKTDVKDGADAASTATKQLASDVGNNMGEARGSLMLLNEELGIKMPRHLTALIAKIPALGAAFSAMLPIVGVVAAVEVIEKLVSAHEKAKEAMLTAMAEIGAKDATVLDGLNEKLNQSKLKFLELADDGAGAAAIKLDMLGHTTLVSLIGSFDNLGKSIDDVLKKMGAEGTFARIMGLSGASDDLKNLQKDVLSIRASGESDTQQAAEIGQKIEWYRDKAKQDLDAMKADRALLTSSDNGALMAGGGHTNDKQLAEQQALYASLNDMAKASATVQQTAAIDTTNLQTEEANKATKEEEKIWLARNTEYQRSLKADETAQNDAYKQAVEAIQLAEKLKIDATRQGSQARLDAVDAAIKDEEAHGLQDTAFYKSLQEEKIKIAQDIANQQIALQRKVAEELGKAQQGMIALQMAAMKNEADSEYKLGAITAAQHIQALREEAAQELALEQQKNAAMLAEIAENDPKRPEYVQKALDADLQAQQKYDNEMVSLDSQALELRKQAWDAGFNQMNSGMTTLVSNMVKGNSSITADLKTMLANMLTSWINYFVQLEAKALEAQLFMAATGLFGSGIGGGLFSQAGGGAGFGGGGAPVSTSAIPNSIPLHATGGHMSANELGIVGDAGPEVWHPDTAGSVVPFDKLKGDGGTHTHNNMLVNINGVSDFDSFRENESQVAARLHAAMVSAARRKG